MTFCIILRTRQVKHCGNKYHNKEFVHENLGIKIINDLCCLWELAEVYFILKFNGKHVWMPDLTAISFIQLVLKRMVFDIK